MAKKTHDAYVQELRSKKPTIIPIEEYKGTKIKSKHQCLICNYIWDVTPTLLLSKPNKCPKCGIENRSKLRRKTIDQFKNEVKKINPEIEVVGEYINIDTPILCRCNICNCEWFANPWHVSHDTGCPKCANLYRRSHEEYVNDVYNVNPDIEIISEFKGVEEKIEYKCKIHNIHLSTTSKLLFMGHNGCPQCNRSKGENMVSKYLNEKGIKFMPQYKFDDCKDILQLPFDFYLPDYNICIEYDGIQHFEPVDFASKGEEWARKMFENTKKHDEIKNNYCLEHGIKLLRIKYTEDINKKLDMFLLECVETAG